jgi:aryl-alcohol dehydrogenase-like predicted oxidoreductase
VIDTAEMYGDGLSEELIGDVLRDWPRKSARPFSGQQGAAHACQPQGVMRAFEASAQRWEWTVSTSIYSTGAKYAAGRDGSRV